MVSYHYRNFPTLKIQFTKPLQTDEMRGKISRCQV